MAAYLKKPFSHNPLIARKPLIRVRYMRGSSTGDPASHRTQDKRSHPASGAQAGTGRSALRPETVAEMRGASEKRPRSCPVGGSESNQTWDNGISLRSPPPVSCKPLIYWDNFKPLKFYLRQLSNLF